jgi:hypothetical protein
MHIPRSKFSWESPFKFCLRARVSAPTLPGTWGFGFWNDPFNLNIGLGGMARRLPVLPNVAWFFYASPPNYLSLRDDHPAQGLLAATFLSPLVPSLILAPAGLVLPLMGLPVTSRLLRQVARVFIKEDAFKIELDPTAWHSYTLDVKDGTATFGIDDESIFATPVAPRGRLGMVIWIDNQYMAFPPQRGLHAGTLASAELAWLEISDLSVEY